MTNDRRLWIETPTLLGRRLDLEPLAVAHAGEMARVLAHVHREHEASQGVARAVGLVPGETGPDGEVRWASG